MQDQPLLSQGSVRKEVKYYSLLILACCLIGTKLLFLELAHFAHIWIFFLEHIAICSCSIITFSLYYIFVKRRTVSFGNYICREISLLKNKMIFLCAFVSGTLNAFGNIFIIFAIKFARDAGSSSSSLNCILMLNVLIVLIAGIWVFGERHSLVQY